MVVCSGYVPTVAVAVNHSGIPSACIHGHSYFLAVVLNLLTMADKHKMVIREDEIPNSTTQASVRSGPGRLEG